MLILPHQNHWLRSLQFCWPNSQACMVFHLIVYTLFKIRSNHMQNVVYLFHRFKHLKLLQLFRLLKNLSNQTFWIEIVLMIRWDVTHFVLHIPRLLLCVYNFITQILKIVVF